MLNKTFFTYSISDRTENSCTYKIKLIKESDIYKGHFPEMPITPGVCQVQIVTEVLSDYLNKPCKLYKAKDIKFLNLINPNEQDSFELTLETSMVSDKQVDVKALMCSEEKNVLKMRASYSFYS